MLFLAIRGRSPDPIGRFWRALCLIVVTALLWWREWWLGMAKRSGISLNKAVFPVYRRLVVLELFRSSRRSPVFFFTELSWW
jgi:hypothetical protein